MNPIEVLYLSFETLGVAYSIHINGIKVAADRMEVQSSNAFPINQWLQPGKNDIRLNLSVPYEQEEYREEKKAVVRILEPGDEPGMEKVISEISWTDQESESFPIDLGSEFQIDLGFPQPYWQQADNLKEAALEKLSSMVFLKKFHQVLDQGEMDGFQDLAKIKTLEMAAAYGMEKEQRLAGQRKFMEELFGDPAWGMEPLNTEDLFFEIEAKGKMLTITNKNGAPALRSRELSEGTIFSVDLHFSRKNGEWALCR